MPSPDYIQTEDTKAALKLYVIWAAQTVCGEDVETDVSEGAKLAKKIYAHFCFDAESPFFSGLGIPVYFRSVPALHSADGIPLSINLDDAERTVVIVLVDSEMALDDAVWVPYITAIFKGTQQSGGRHLLLPVALSEGTLKFIPLARQNFIRYHRFVPDQQWLVLRLWLVNEIARHFRSPFSDGSNQQSTTGERVSPPPVRIFLSHAKADGRDEAALLLQKLREIPSIPFFDEVDVGPGYDFGNEIDLRISDAAVVVILTDAYSDRSWCQKEILAAKRMQRPLVVIDDLRGKVYRSFPYLGNVPTIRKTPGDEAEIIGLILDEALRSMVLSRRMAQLLGRYPDLHAARYLLRAPEALDGYHLVGLPVAHEPESAELQTANASENPVTVLYPDPPLGVDELAALNQTLLSRYRFATLLHVGGTEHLKKWKVGLSVSETPDFGPLGLADTHLNEVTLELERHLLAGGARLTYGGDLRKGGFTEILTQLVATYNATGSTDFKPIENYQAWPFYLSLTRDREAALKQIMHCHRIPKKTEVKTEFASINPDIMPDPANPDVPFIKAKCLTKMRESMNRDTNARIFLGGRTRGWFGVFPGILEEAYLAMRDGKPIFLLGGFGGCTQALIDLLRGQDSDEMRSALQERPADLISAYRATMSEPALIDYEGIRDFFKQRGVAGLNNNLSLEENEHMFRALDTEEIISLLFRGLNKKSD